MQGFSACENPCMETHSTDATIAVIIDPREARDLLYRLRKSDSESHLHARPVTPMVTLEKALAEFVEGDEA